MQKTVDKSAWERQFFRSDGSYDTYEWDKVDS